MKIDVLCNDGSPLGMTMKDLFGRGKRGIGVGGSEYALLTLLEGFSISGHDVRLYNDPLEADASPFEQLPIAAFDFNENRDILINFRSPNPRAIVSKGLKVWWSCDQYTVGSFKDFAPHMHRIVCISPFHANYFKDTYGITGVDVVDIPIRTQDFEMVADEAASIRGRCIFTSVPDRGLHNLNAMWNRLKDAVPELSLVITSDYRLWGLPDPRNEKHKAIWMDKKDVTFLGAIDRLELLRQQARAEFLLYPCEYDELFCVAVAEAECMGVIPITSGVGALTTTNMGEVIAIDPRNRGMFGIELSEKLKFLYENPSAYTRQSNELRVKSLERFRVENIVRQWEERVFND
jgi:glycosyltransferase involved in cell wall biosynthesis